MKDIKFRAWSIEKQAWVYFGLGDVPTWVHPAEAEQYTGLKDKNGKEIYEGDILKLTDYHGERIVKISFHNGVYFYTGDGFSDEYIFNSREREVIGNIYESPNLLHQLTG